jgi:hypothetical protein
MEELSSRLKAVLFLGAIAVAVTGVFFVAAVDSPEAAQVMAFVCLIIAEIVATFSLCVVEGELLGPGPKLFRMGSYSSIGAYLLFGFAVSLVYVLFSPEKYGLLIGLHAILLGLLVGAETLFFLAGRSGARSDSLAKARAEAIVDLGSRLGAIRDRLTDSPQKAKLLQILEEIKFFNRNADVEVDADISGKIDELDQAVPADGDAAPGVDRILGELSLLAKRRVEASKISKRGGF